MLQGLTSHTLTTCLAILRACHQFCHQQTLALMVLVRDFHSAPPVAFRWLPLQLTRPLGPFGALQRHLRISRAPPATPADVTGSSVSSSDTWSRVQETINRLQKPHGGSAFVPILEDPADILTNIIVLSRDAPKIYDKHKKKVTTLGDALEWYSEHRPEFIAALDAASGQTSSAGYHAMGVALRDLVLHHGWQQSPALAFLTKFMARQSSPVAALANLVIKAYLKLTDPETAQFVVCCQEGLDKDSVSALLDDIDKLAPSEPLYLAQGMVRLDPSATLTCQGHWTDLWVCLAGWLCAAPGPQTWQLSKSSAQGGSFVATPSTTWRGSQALICSPQFLSTNRNGSACCLQPPS